MKKHTENFRTQSSAIVPSEERNYEFMSSVSAIKIAQSSFPRPRIFPPLCPIKRYTQVVLKPYRLRKKERERREGKAGRLGTQVSFEMGRGSREAGEERT